MTTLVARLLTELGEADISHAADSSSLESLARTLLPARHALRVVALDAPALSQLALPALVRYGEQLAVLRKVAPRNAELELASGATLAVERTALLASSGGRALEIQPCLDRQGDFSSRLWSFLAGRAGELGSVLLLGVCMAALGLITPAVTHFVIDRALPEQSPKWLSLLALAVLLVALQRSLFSWLEQRATLALHARLEAATATRLFDHLLRIPYPSLARRQVGAWLETLRGARHVQGFLTESLLRSALQLLMALVYGVALALALPWLALSVAAVGAVMVGVSLLFALRAASLERSQIEAASRQRDGLHELLRGMQTFVTAGAVEHGLGRWLARMLDERALSLQQAVLAVRARVWLGALRESVQLAVFLWAARLGLAGELSVGGLVSTLMLSDQLLQAMRQAAALLQPWLNARSHLPRIDALLAEPDVTRAQPTRSLGKLRKGDPALVFEDVWFRYGPEQPWVLEGYGLRVGAFEHHALRGRSGMGKTTILRLAAGLYLPERGTVRVHGFEPQQLRGEICYLPQDARLFQGTILQNLRLLSGASQLALMDAAADSGLADWVKELPMGFETVLTSGATTLSGGQRQLIAWTAAMASERRLLLVDEALAQVDRTMRAHLLRMADARARTVISVEHERV